MKDNRIYHQYFFILIYRLAIILVLFTFCRIGFYLFNRAMFPGLSTTGFLSAVYGGIRFDLSAILYFNIPVIFLHILPSDIRYHRYYQVIVKYVFLFINAIALGLNCADFVYYRFIQKRATAEVFRTFSHEHNQGILTFRFMFDYWPATLLFLIMMIILIILYNRLKPYKPSGENKIASIGFHLAVFVITPFLTVVGIRGGFYSADNSLSFLTATHYVKNPRNIALVINTPFSIIKSWNNTELKKLHYFPQDEIAHYYNPVHEPKPKGEFRPLNVIVIILESFSKEYIGAFNHNLDHGTYKGYTPFLDSLISVSKSFRYSIANGRESIEAIPAILASIPSFETPYIVTPYEKNKIQSLASILSKKGYYTAFFHGASNGSMGFDKFTKRAGFRDYYGKDQYPVPGDFDGVWGIWDEPFFNFFEKKLDSLPQPFFVSIFSVSSHHPFNVPEKYKGIFKKGPIPILQTIGYTDWVLREFFNSASKEPWFDSTLFVLTADHTSQMVHPGYQNDFGFYSIPILFYMHGSKLKGMDDEIVQQADIMPSILDYLNYDKKYFAFGNDIFDRNTEHYAFNSSGVVKQLYMNDYLLQMLDGKTVGLYNFKKDPYILHNLAGQIPAVQQPMEDKLHAILQTYNERLIGNDMTVKQP